MKITIIGSGNMGGAVARGLAGNGFPAEKIVCTAKTAGTLEALSKNVPGIGISDNNAKACEGADWIFLCVKPWLVAEIAAEIREAVPANAAVVSFAAGISLSELEAFFETAAGTRPLCFRAMPNVAAAVAQSETFLAAPDSAPAGTLSVLRKMLGALGNVRVVPETKLAAGTALASCGIAFAMRYIRAACEGGVELGFYPGEAREIVLQTLRGAVAVLEKSGANPESEIDRVTTPGGVTIRGLNAMEDAGFTRAVIAGLRAANR